jgi:hypothetical protein
LNTHRPSIVDVIRCYRKPAEATVILSSSLVDQQKKASNSHTLTGAGAGDEVCLKYINRIRQKLKQSAP